MWWRRNACLWLSGRTIRVLKRTRTWYGTLAFCQGHTEYEKQWKIDWLSSPEAIRAKVPLLLDRYGLTGWRLHFLLGGPDILWKQITLATKEVGEARTLISRADLLDEAGRPYGFDVGCPEKNQDGLYDWSVGAYPADCIDALCSSVVHAGAAISSLDLLPAFLGRLQPDGEGCLSFQERDERLCHRVRLKQGRPCSYEVQMRDALADGPAAFTWKPEGNDETCTLPPTAAVGKVMEAYGLSQATASLILL